jgi:hypothetical protein
MDRTGVDYVKRNKTENILQIFGIQSFKITEMWNRDFGEVISVGKGREKGKSEIWLNYFIQVYEYRIMKLF